MQEQTAWSDFAKDLSPGNAAPRTAMRLFPLTAPSSIPTQHDTLVKGTGMSPGAPSLQRQVPHRPQTAKQALPAPPGHIPLPQLHRLSAGYVTLGHNADSSVRCLYQQRTR